MSDRVDDFTLTDETGTPRSLSELLRDGPVVLFFYPIASSGGCTAEACHFRDLAADFAAVGAQPVGISSDGQSAQSAFAAAHSLGFPLLTDAGHRVAKQLGAYRRWLPGGMHTQRKTFVIDTDRRLLGVVASEKSRHWPARAAGRRHDGTRGPAGSCRPLPLAANLTSDRRMWCLWCTSAPNAPHAAIMVGRRARSANSRWRNVRLTGQRPGRT